MFVIELEKAIVRMSLAVVELRKQGNNDMVSNTQSSPQEVIEYLTILLIKADDLSSQSKLFSSYQVIPIASNILHKY